MNSAFIDKRTLHFHVCLHALVLTFKFNKCVLKTIPSFPVFNYFTTFYLAEAAKNQLQVLLLRNWVKFADK